MVSLDWLRTGLLLFHALAGAAWFGSIFYSLFVLYPRVNRHFENLAERERLLISLGHGARWHMVAAISLVALSGVSLVLMPRAVMTPPWLALIAVKAVLLLVSAVLFWRVSWHWWPARLFALESELPALHRRFRKGAFYMLAMVGASFALGVISASLARQ